MKKSTIHIYQNVVAWFMVSLSTAHAAEPETTASHVQQRPVLEEIIVTAQKRQQRLEDVPALVNPLSDEMLQSANVTKFQDVGRMIPGLDIQGDEGGLGATVKMRGIGSDSLTSIPSSIGYFYNEIPVIQSVTTGASLFDLDFFDLDRIEVLKGPQSTLYGTSVSTGAISLYTRKPSLSDGLSGKVSTTFGDHNRQEYRGVLNIPIGGILALRATGYDTAYDGQVVNLVDGSRLNTETWGGRVQLLYEPSANLELLFSYEKRFQFSSGGSGANTYLPLGYPDAYTALAAANQVTLVPADPFSRKIQVNHAAKQHIRRELGSLHGKWTIADRWSLNSVTAYQAEDYRHYGSDPYGGHDSTPGLFDTLANFGTARQQYFTQELRLNYTGRQLTSTLGVFYEHTNVPRNRLDMNFAGFPLLFDLGTGAGDGRSIFGHNSFRFNEKWEAVFGARYSEASSDTRSESFAFAGAYSGVTPDPDFSRIPLNSVRPSAWGGTVKGIYHTSDAVSIYAGIDRGFKLGGNNGYGAPAYGTEVALNYEVGVKGQFLDKTLRVTSAIYRQTYSNYQDFNGVADPSTGLYQFFILNAAKVVVQGVETSAEWLATDHLTLSGSMGLNDARFKDYKNAQCNQPQVHFGECSSGVQDLSDTRLNNAPLWSVNLSSQYGGALHDTGWNWYVRGEYVFRSQTHGALDNDPGSRIPAYGLYNASLGVSSAANKIEAILWVKNLTNKNYYTGIIDSSLGYPGLSAYLGFERSAGVTLTYSY